MRKSCVQQAGKAVQSLGVSSVVVRSPRSTTTHPAYKLGAYTRIVAQVSGAKSGTYEQLLAHINGLVISSVHIIHRAYSNYNYVIN
jgi:hypothetical protein